MKDILYKKRQSLKNRHKVISISERSEDKDCKTHVRKSFAYMVSKTEPIDYGDGHPEIYIKKSFNSKTREERFSFKVKGFFFMNQRRSVLKVDFCHTLNIHIAWKKKAFSSNKSATLT